jgi:hypothetical protein
MASSGKKKTTMAKLNREAKMRERRMDKQARKAARKLAATLPADAADGTPVDGFDDGADAPDEAGVPVLAKA